MVSSIRKRGSPSGDPTRLKRLLSTSEPRAVEHVETKLAVRVADRQRAVDGAAADEDGEPSEERALRRVQQVVAPGDGPAQGALSLGDIAGAARQERQAPVEPGEDRHRIEELAAGRSQLDREREAVEADADGGDRRCVLRVELEVGAHGTRSLDEQRDGIVPGERFGWRQVARVRDAQRRDRILLLAPEVKDLAARRQDGQVGRGPEEPTHHRCAIHDLLEVVGDEQQVQIAQVRLKELDDRPLRVLAETDGLGDGRRDQAGVADRRELHEDRRRSHTPAGAARPREG